MPQEQEPRYLDFVPQHFNKDQMASLQELKRGIDVARSITPEIIPDNLKSANRHLSDNERPLLPKFVPNSAALALFDKLNARFNEDLAHMPEVQNSKSVSCKLENHSLQVIIHRATTEDHVTFFIQTASKITGEGGVTTFPVHDFSINDRGKFQAYLFQHDPGQDDFDWELIAEHSSRQPRFDDKAEKALRKAMEVVLPFTRTTRQALR